MHNWSVFITDQCSFDEGLFFLSFSSFMIKADDKLCVTGASFTMSWKRSSTFLRVARIKCRRFLGLFVCSIPNETFLRHSKWFKQAIDFDNVNNVNFNLWRESNYFPYFCDIRCWTAASSACFYFPVSYNFCQYFFILPEHQFLMKNVLKWYKNCWWW